MSIKTLIPAILIAFTAAPGASAQYMPDLQDLFGRRQEQPRERANAVTVDYNVDFHYFLDVRAFGISQDIFMESGTINIARVSPSAVVRFDQGSVATHRLSLGIDLTKNMGANPTEFQDYSAAEHNPSIANTGLMRDIFFYYNYLRNVKGGRLGFYAGIHPRTVLKGDYSRALFADEVIYTDPNIEGITVQYLTPKFSFELAGDLFGKKGVDRIGSEVGFGALEYRPLKWAAIGLSGAFTHVTGNYLYPAEVDYAFANPYLKFDFAPLLGLQEFYVKGGGIGTYQLDHRIKVSDPDTGDPVGDSPHYPFGMEAMLGVRHWGIGFEDTFYYGENLMEYCGSAYSRISNADKYIDTLYQGEEFYFTRRSVPTWYNRAEVYWQPLSTGFVTARVSAVGHFITPAGEIGPYVGLQAKASLLFNLDAFRHPSEDTPAARTRRARRNTERSGGPLFNL